MIEDQIEKNGNRLVVDVAADVTTLFSDELKFRQILLNILANAAKFTSQGTIRLTVRSERPPLGTLGSCSRYPTAESA